LFACVFGERLGEQTSPVRLFACVFGERLGEQTYRR